MTDHQPPVPQPTEPDVQKQVAGVEASEPTTQALSSRGATAVHVNSNAGGSVAYAPEAVGSSRAPIWIAFAIVMAIILGVVGFLLSTSGGDGGQVVGGQDHSQPSPTGMVPEDEPPAEGDPQGHGQDETSGGNQNAQPSPEEIKEILASMARRDAEDPVAMGPVDAPVVIIEYADFTCPYCGQFAQETKPQIVSEYVDKGLVRFEWRDLPLFGDPSAAAALGGRAAAEQGKFWEYQDAIFGAGIPRESVTKEAVIEIAKQIGIPDMAKFDAGFTNEEFYQAISRDFEEAQRLSVQSTPTFLINGQALMGAAPYADFQAAIEQALKEAGEQ